MTFETILVACSSLALVVGLVLLAQRAARWGGLAPRIGGGGGRLALVEAMAIDPRRRLCLLRCDDRHVLVLTGGAQDMVVGWVEAPAPAPAPAPALAPAPAAPVMAGVAEGA